MRESTPNADFPEDLALLALLYSSGELEGDEAAAFEARLAVDQEARDAVAQAVQLSLTAAGERCAPDAAWREETKRRLLQRVSLWQRLSGPRVYRGHPAVWSCLGALAASVVLSLMPAPATHQESAQVVPPAQTAVLPSAEEAAVWAEIANNDSLVKAHDEQTRRKLRTTDERRLPRASMPNR